MSRFMTKRQGGVLLPATTFVVLQTTQSNVKSAGAGVALTYRAHAGLFLRWGRGRTLGFRCASAGRRREEHEQNGPDRRSGSLGRPGFFPITPVYRKCKETLYNKRSRGHKNENPHTVCCMGVSTRKSGLSATTVPPLLHRFFSVSREG